MVAPNGGNRGVSRDLGSNGVRFAQGDCEWLETGAESEYPRALSFQNVWVDSSFKVTVYTDWERSGCGEPIIDVGFLAAEMMVAQPLELRERYNQAFDPDFDRIGLTKAFLGAYLKQTGIPNTAELQANFRASFYLKLVSIVIYQQRDPLLKRGVEQIRSMLSVLLRNDPTQKLVNLSGK